MNPSQPEQQKQGPSLRKDISRSSFGDIIIFDEFKQPAKEKSQRAPNRRENSLEKLIFSVFETIGFETPESVLRIWFGEEEIDRDLEMEMMNMGTSANQAMQKIFGQNFLRINTKTDPNGKPIKEIHNPVELIEIIQKTIPTDEVSMSRVHQAIIKVAIMHIINSIRRGYEQPKVEAIAKNLIEDVRQACARARKNDETKPVIEETFFNPQGENIEFAKEIPETMSKHERKRWKQGVKLNIFQDENGNLYEDQPVLYVDATGKSELSVLLKCLNKNIDHIEGEILDIERMRIEFPKGSLESMSEEERAETITIIAHILQNILGTNIIRGEGRDEYADPSVAQEQNPATTGKQKRIKFGLTYRPNIKYETVLGIARELQQACMASTCAQRILSTTITIPQPRRSKLKRALAINISAKNLEIAELEHKIECLSKGTKKENARNKLTKAKKERNELVRISNLIKQAGSIIPEDYDIEISSEEITSHGNTSRIKTLRGVPLEIQIVEHVPEQEIGQDHSRYEAKKNATIADELGLVERFRGSGAYVTSLSKYIGDLARIIIDETETETVLRRGKRTPTTIREHAKMLMRKIIENERNDAEVANAIATTGDAVRNAIGEIITDPDSPIIDNNNPRWITYSTWIDPEHANSLRH